ncbi:diadenylate cyclase CdaA [Clostridium cochlearium]|jgi:diadenylate cyclase|uniref:Diadenylate cyclase n=1 Tax=Clostridium cochlearium TaxID=1494 RepID=A0A240B121_CLOCO|nr:diadenylate cyclase CdaA [Clostridium cochlearium]MBV1817612.1 diadenylate cyclase CdaA [Bacteroidales bacterium MSK.15.36]NSJ90190.1 TIGR00159 family protein [Coprococcus sp. MSK.21.13]MBU5270438.1 diadenylate cyclase CdaA [Clostridium cochlearium]MCG4572251.1 diadenylate cyclase CdaA [Clostridium cochlearium]MCG4579325.1 diadenylate cyclase CdaA [Clostridium cochlearium]
MEMIDTMINSIKNMNLSSILDILAVSYIFYKGYMLIKETRAEQLLKGIIFLIILIPISKLLNLEVLSWILSNTITIGVLSFIIIFQPEIRRALEHIGRSAFNERHLTEDEHTMEKIINEIITAVDNLSKTKTGALIVIERATRLGETISTGVKIDAIVSSQLLENIFVVNTPLHDGATIIRSDRIISAGCFLPLTTNKNVDKSLGTRHRSAIGISENSDAIVVVVSEETGTISLAVNGSLTRNYDKDKLRDILFRIVKKDSTRKINLREQVTTWIRKTRENK